MVQDEIWEGLKHQDDFKRRKAAEEVSYVWDRLIEHIVEHYDEDLTEEIGPSSSENPAVERVARIMARETRFARRLLAQAFEEFHKNESIRSRVVVSPSGVVYMYLTRPRGYDRNLRKHELLARLFLGRGMNPASKLVVGLATEDYAKGEGFTLDVAAFHKEIWTTEDQEEMESIQAQTGAFVSPKFSRSHELEYPPEENGA